MIHGRKVIGIIGGMGPMATADLFIKIIESTDAKTDQEHLHVLLFLILPVNLTTDSFAK